MARKLSFLSQLLIGDHADRRTINANAEALEDVEATVKELKAMVARQAEEILQLRATIMGIVEVLGAKVQLDDAELESAVNGAWRELRPPPPEQPVATDPYRGLPGGEPTPEDVEAAKARLRVAEGHHFATEFDEARAVYAEIIERYPGTKQAATAKQQLQNLKRA